MRKQLKVFSRPFRKTYRPRRPPRSFQMIGAKRQKAKQEYRRRKTARLRDGSEPKKGVADWSPEQLERIWRSTTG